MSSCLALLAPHLDVPDGLAGVIVHRHVGADLLAVVVDLLVQRHLQVDLALREGEPFGHQGRRQAAASRRWRVLQLWPRGRATGQWDHNAVSQAQVLSSGRLSVSLLV